MIIVKNKPKVLLEKYKVVSLKQIKELWKYRYNTYAIIMSSVFLGVSWSFLSSCTSCLLSVVVFHLLRPSGSGNSDGRLDHRWDHIRSCYVGDHQQLGDLKRYFCVL